MSVQTSGTARAIAESLGEIAGIRGPRPVTAAELELGIAALTRGYARSFETGEQLGRAALQLALYDLPDDYFEHAAAITTPVLFMTGANNRVFTDSNIECHRRLEAIAPGRHRLHVFAGYGHQDVFMGQNAARDTFPTILHELNKPN